MQSSTHGGLVVGLVTGPVLMTGSDVVTGLEVVSVCEGEVTEFEVVTGSDGVVTGLCVDSGSDVDESEMVVLLDVVVSTELLVIKGVLLVKSDD